jgi:cysteine sulfinate desulfinase/cysteine desulfurase-like protein
VSITIPGISGERLVIELDARGIWCASKSACKEDSDEASHVLTAIRNASAQNISRQKTSGKNSSQKSRVTETDGAVRLSLGQGTTPRTIRYVAKILAEVVETIRAFEKTISRK